MTSHIKGTSRTSFIDLREGTQVHGSTIRISKPLNFRDVYVGREEELLKLEGIFRRTASGRKSKYPSLVLIGGESGAGKSTLVCKLREHLKATEEEFFWISGKFQEGHQKALDISFSDLGSAITGNNSADTTATDTLNPFAAIVDAFSGFCEELENEEPETLEEVKLDILEAVGQQGALLTFMIPSLTKIIGKQVEAGHESLEGQETRFHFVFKNFIQALASQCRSVVLVLDDIHRADAASLELLSSLTTNQLKHVMFIGTYRTKEVDDHHRFTKWMKGIQEAQAGPAKPEQSTAVATNKNPTTSTVTTFGLSGLDMETINLLISQVLDIPPDDTRSLAHIVYTKTDGNTFYVIQYMLFLKKKQLLWFDVGKRKWGWDEPGIREEAAVTTTLLDFTRDKLLQSEVAPKILPVAACMGLKFSRENIELVLASLAQADDAALREIANLPGTDVPEMLKMCEKEGFIENRGNKTYSFVHDKVQEAALILQTSYTMQQIRYETGCVLLRRLDEKELEEKLFVVVNLLNVTRKNSSVSPFEVAKLNLKAAKKSKRLAAFSSAGTYVEHALASFPRDAGDEEQRVFFLELCSLGAEVEAVVGRMDRMEKYCQAVLKSKADYTVYEQLRVQNVLMDRIANRGGQVGEALTRCTEILEKLECTLPKTTIGQGVKAVTSIYQSKAPSNIPKLEDVDSMKLMTDTAKLEAMGLLNRAATYSYIEANRDVFSVCTTKMARWTIRYGLCDRSPSAFAFLGIILMHCMGDYKAGTKYAELAVAVMRRLQSIASQDESKSLCSQSRATFVAYGMVLYWVRPLKEYKDELVEGYNSGMRAGDTESACWNTFYDIGIKFAAGKSLTTLEELCRSGVNEMNALQRGESEVYTRLQWQGFLNLIDKSGVEGETELTGSAMFEDDYLERKEEWGSKVLPNHFEHTKTFLSVYFGKYEEGAKFVVERGDRFLLECPGSSWCLTDPYFRGVCLYAAAQATANTANKRQYRNQAQKARATLQSWANKGNPNAAHQLKLLDAEHDAYLGKRDSAKKLYELACSTASFTHDAALASQRFGEFLLSSPSEDDQKDGKSKLGKAIRLYDVWGAKAVVRSLQERFPFLDSVNSAVKIDHNTRSFQVRRDTKLQTGLSNSAPVVTSKGLGSL